MPIADRIIVIPEPVDVCMLFTCMHVKMHRGICMQLQINDGLEAPRGSERVYVGVCLCVNVHVCVRVCPSFFAQYRGRRWRR